jgi:hypothetical protein
VACEQAGFTRDGVRQGIGLKEDCVDPIVAGSPQPRRASLPLPTIDPGVVAACRGGSPGAAPATAANMPPPRSSSPTPPIVPIGRGGGPGSGLVADGNGQTVYDPAANVTWLANANLAAKQSFGVSGINRDGSMSWTTAQKWIAAMNAANYLGSNHWSLPTTQLPDNNCSQNPKSAAFGYNCTGSQMGNLYYNQLAGAIGSTIDLEHNANYALFNNFQPYLYWSSTLWPRVPNSAFSFSFGNGFQGTNVFVNAMYAIAVAPGKVGGR